MKLETQIPVAVVNCEQPGECVGADPKDDGRADAPSSVFPPSTLLETLKVDPTADEGATHAPRAKRAWMKTEKSSRMKSEENSKKIRKKKRAYNQTRNQEIPSQKHQIHEYRTQIQRDGTRGMRSSISPTGAAVHCAA